MHMKFCVLRVCACVVHGSICVCESQMCTIACLSAAVHGHEILHVCVHVSLHLESQMCTIACLSAAAHAHEILRVCVRVLYMEASVCVNHRCAQLRV